MSMASGNGDVRVLKAVLQSLVAISSVDKVWETCNVEDSSEFIDCIHHSRQLFDLLLKACLAPCTIYAAFNYLYSSQWFTFFMFNHPQDDFSVWGLKIRCQLSSRCWIGYESWKTLLKKRGKKTLPWRVRVMSVLPPPQIENGACVNSWIG